MIQMAEFWFKFDPWYYERQKTGPCDLDIDSFMKLWPKIGRPLDNTMLNLCKITLRKIHDIND